VRQQEKGHCRQSIPGALSPCIIGHSFDGSFFFLRHFALSALSCLQEKTYKSVRKYLHKTCLNELRRLSEPSLNFIALFELYCSVVRRSRALPAGTSGEDQQRFSAWIGGLYEVVNGDHTYEVQIDVDEETDIAVRSDVVDNLWRSDATKSVFQKGVQLSLRGAPSTTLRTGSGDEAISFQAKIASLRSQ